MGSKRPQPDPISAHQRKAVAARRVGCGAKCACGETRPEALIAGRNPVTCAACQRRRRGRKTVDNHHVAGKTNGPVTIPIPVNDHRAALSVAQYGWPRETLENSEGSPLLAAAGQIRGYVDTNDYLAETLLLPRAEMLETLNGFLVSQFGPRWWVNTDLEQFAPKHSSNDAS